jgi:uncharacterized membrane protein YkvA (DUF1232 family)
VIGVVLGVAAGLLLLWGALLVALLAVRPRGRSLTDAVRLLPDLLRLVTRLARDRSLPRGLRWRLVGLGVYLALPIDLVPDFVPVVGYADDAIVAAFVLRSVARRAGPEAIALHWPGTEPGLLTLLALLHIPLSEPKPSARISPIPTGGA